MSKVRSAFGSVNLQDDGLDRVRKAVGVEPNSPRQGPVIASMGRTIWAALGQSVMPVGHAPSLPPHMCPHWIRPYAKAFGVRSTTLHGFATMAKGFDAIVGVEIDGEWQRLSVCDVRFTRPLVLPASVGLFVEGRPVFVGNDAGEPAYLVGGMETRA